MLPTDISTARRQFAALPDLPGSQELPPVAIAIEAFQHAKGDDERERIVAAMVGLLVAGTPDEQALGASFFRNGAAPLGRYMDYVRLLWSEYLRRDENTSSPIGSLVARTLIEAGPVREQFKRKILAAPEGNLPLMMQFFAEDDFDAEVWASLSGVVRSATTADTLASAARATLPYLYPKLAEVLAQQAPNLLKSMFEQAPNPRLEELVRERTAGVDLPRA